MPNRLFQRKWGPRPHLLFTMEYRLTGTTIQQLLPTAAYPAIRFTIADTNPMIDPPGTSEKNSADVSVFVPVKNCRFLHASYANETPWRKSATENAATNSAKTRQPLPPSYSQQQHHTVILTISGTHHLRSGAVGREFAGIDLQAEKRNFIFHYLPAQSLQVCFSVLIASIPIISPTCEAGYLFTATISEITLVLKQPAFTANKSKRRLSQYRYSPFLAGRPLWIKLSTEKPHRPQADQRTTTPSGTARTGSLELGSVTSLNKNKKPEPYACIPVWFLISYCF